MGEVLPFECYSFMHPCDSFAVLPSLRRTFSEFGMLALDFGKGFLFLTEKAGVLYFYSIRQHGKGLESYVNAHLRGYFRQSFRVTFNRERGIPLPCRGTAYREGLDLATDGAMQHDLEMTDARSVEFPLRINLTTRLRIGDAVIAVLALETREPRFLGML